MGWYFHGMESADCFCQCVSELCVRNDSLISGGVMA